MNIIWAEEMEDVLQTSRRGLYNRIRRGMLPKPLKISGRMCWRRQDWDKWLEDEAKRQGVVVQPEETKSLRRRRGRPTKVEQGAMKTAEERRRM